VAVRPGARQSQVVGIREGELQVRVAAPPRQGKANRELVALLARLLGVPPSRIVLVRGGAGRHKVLEVVGLTREEALRRLAP
jgi:uncharacterized protein (TIGR00251 family)